MSDKPGKAGEPHPVALPVRYRPFGARLATAAAASVLTAAVVFLWLMLPSEVQDDFTLFERLTLIAFFIAVLVVLFGLYRSAAIADDDGLTVVNGYRTHHYPWAEVVRVSLSPHRPWALIDLADGETMSVLAIQGSDGDRAVRSARELATVLAQQSRTSRND
ncbi:MAG TPA: PH domain-containing protein [Nocardioidaceae bacterium]|nr:PH domain-containing protein [Nocardioidaceae bacterium]